MRSMAQVSEGGLEERDGGLGFILRVRVAGLAGPGRPRTEEIEDQTDGE